MNKVSQIASLVKKIHRTYAHIILTRLEAKGYSDLRPSFLEILSFICDHEGETIKSIGSVCRLKKQTMTSHLNELEKRGYLRRETSPRDKREQCVYLTDYGKNFRLSMLHSLEGLEDEVISQVGTVELERVQLQLENLSENLKRVDERRLL